MANNKLSDLRNHLFESIEKLKSNNDPQASECEKMDINTAKAISNIAGDIIESYKVEVQALEIISKASNPNVTIEILNRSGVFNSEIKQLT